MDTKDTIANFTSATAIALTMADIQMIISFCVLITALILNISRLYTIYKKRKDTHE